MAISKIPNTGRRLSDAFAAIAIPENAGKAPQAVSAGQYVIWNGALHTATRDISSGETLSLSSLAPVSGGGLNALHGILTPKLHQLPYVANATLGNNNAGFHNSIYRGKSLGSALTSAQSTAIRAGTFDDLFIGDYWTINGIVWRIAGFDMYYKCGDTSLDTHHLCVVPDTALENSVWNDTDNTVTGGPEGGAGYIGSKIRAAVKASGGSESMVIAAFGDSHVLSYRALYPSAYSSEGEATGWAWTNARVELMNETMVYGHQACANNGRYNGYENGIDARQLPLFMMNPTLGRIQASWWLRSVFFAAHVCRVNSDGSADYAGAHYSNGVRPFALIA